MKIKVMLPNECEKMSDEWWVMEIEWQKLSDEKGLPKQALSYYILQKTTIFYLTSGSLNKYKTKKGRSERGRVLSHITTYYAISSYSLTTVIK